MSIDLVRLDSNTKDEMTASVGIQIDGLDLPDFVKTDVPALHFLSKLGGLQLANATLSPIHVDGKVSSLHLDTSISMLMDHAFSGSEFVNSLVSGKDMHMSVGSSVPLVLKKRPNMLNK